MDNNDKAVKPQVNGLDETDPAKTINIGNAGKLKPKKSHRPKVLLSFLIVVAAVLIGIIIVDVYRSNTTSKVNATTITKNAPAQVSITSSGFIPATISIKAGQAIVWTNSDTKTHEVASDPYPNDNALAGFVDKQPLNQTETYSFIFDKAGTYTYHDTLNPYKFHGTVIVKR